MLRASGIGHVAGSLVIFAVASRAGLCYMAKAMSKAFTAIV